MTKEYLESILTEYGVAFTDSLADRLLKEFKPCENADVKLIHTQGLDEGIRCAMCTNLMANHRGCDGACVVNEIMYKKVLDVIRKQIVDKAVYELPPVTHTCEELEKGECPYYAG